MSRRGIEIMVDAFLLAAIASLLLFTWYEGHNLAHFGG